MTFQIPRVSSAAREAAAIVAIDASPSNLRLCVTAWDGDDLARVAGIIAQIRQGDCSGWLLLLQYILLARRDDAPSGRAAAKRRTPSDRIRSDAVGYAMLRS